MIAQRGSGRALTDRTVKGTRLRVLTLGTGTSGAVLIARPLTEVEHEMSRVLLILLIVGAIGIAIAAALGALVARAALAPIARFTRRTETLAGGLDLSQRLPEGGRDELARLAGSFNATLDALEHSLAAQRNLIADASHELRTPIASLRANIQVLAEAERLPPDDQASLRADIVGELDELTRLVGDVVELARGTGSKGVVEDVRLEEIVRDAVQRTQRRSNLHFQVQLEPAIVRGEADRVDRAVSNLLDNARKWSPAGEPIEVDLHEGVLTVRDHGPGFEEADLPHVFERFYRADRARKLPGSGLGLAIVRQAAEAHHGYVKAENAPGGGALVQVSFGAVVSTSGVPA
jgi:two-component system sensor histidine kinase MprB